MENKNQALPNQFSATQQSVGGDNTPVATGASSSLQDKSQSTNLAADSRYYPIENLESPSTSTLDQASQTAPASSPQFSSQFAAEDPQKLKQKKKRTRVIATIVIVALILASLLGWLIIRRNQQEQDRAAQEIPEQNVQLIGINNGLAGLSVDAASSQVLVNGNIVSSGSLYLLDSSSDFFGQLSIEELSDNQSYVLPNSSGTVCLDSNNCGFLTNTQLDGAVAELEAGVGITINNETISISQTVVTNDTGFIHGGNSFGEEAILGTNDNFSLSFETEGATRLTIDTDGHIGLNAAPIAEAGLYATHYITDDANCFLGCFGQLTAAGVISQPLVPTTVSALGVVVGLDGGVNVDNVAGLSVLNSSAVGGSTITNNYGILISDQTSGTNDYGIAIRGADTQALWIGSGANNTDAANGIAFGSSRDTNLYRFGADTLRTDDNAWVYRALAVGDYGDDSTFANLSALGIGETFDDTNFCAFGCYGIYNSVSSDRTTSLGQLAAQVNSVNVEDGRTVANAIGLRIANGDVGAGGTITNNFGIQVDDMTSGTNDYGIAISGADTQALWISYGADNTDAANGIGFGLSRDTNLYRGAANQLNTDDNLDVALHGAIGNTATVDQAGWGTYIVDNGAYTPATSQTVLTISETFSDVSSTEASVGIVNTITGVSGSDGSGLLLGMANTTIADTSSGDAIEMVSGLNNFVFLSGTGQVGFATGITNALDASALAADNTSLIGSANYVITSSTNDTDLVYGQFIALSHQGGAGVDLQSAVGLGIAIENGGGGGSIADAYGINIGPTAGDIQASIGIKVGAQSGPGSGYYGIIIDTADDQTLWLSSDADNTTANAGIGFGASLDTNLYRGAANQLNTDDNLDVGLHAAFGADATVDDSVLFGSPAILYNYVLSVEEDLTIATESINAGQLISVNADTDLACNCQVSGEDINVSAGGTGSISNVYGQIITTIVEDSVEASVSAGILNSTYHTGSGDSSSIYGIYNDVYYGGSGSTASLVGYNTEVAIDNGTAGSVRGAVIYVDTSGSTVTGDVSGIQISTFADTADNVYGINIQDTGAVTSANTAYGISVGSVSGATANYGIGINATDTQTLWVSQDADNTTAAAGIAFGSSRDTNLYRSAANTLRTDGLFSTGGQTSLVTEDQAIDSFLSFEDQLSVGSGATLTVSNDGMFRGILFNPTVVYDDPFVLTGGRSIEESPILTNPTGVAKTMPHQTGFYASATIQGDGALFTTSRTAFLDPGNYTTINGGSVSATNHIGFGSDLAVGSGVTVVDRRGVDIIDGTGAGSVTDQYGIFVRPLTKGTNDYGIRVDAADTQTLWISGNADNTTAAAGIAFGSSRDTNLYRGAADLLTTDDSLYVAGHLAVGSSATAGPDQLIYVDETFTDSSGAQAGLDLRVTTDPGGASTADVFGGNYLVEVAAGAGNNADALRGVGALVNHGGGGTVDSAVGTYGSVYGTGVYTDAYGASGQYINQGSGTTTNGWGVRGVVQNASSGTITNAAGVYGAGSQAGSTLIDQLIGTSGIIDLDVAATAGITDGYALYAATYSDTSVAANITNAHGLYVADQTGTATNEYGITIEGADTQALWIGSGADNTDAANGIAFGSSRDTNLYRGAADVLQTDDSLRVDSKLQVGGSGGGTVDQCMTVLGLITCDVALEAYNTSTQTANASYGASLLLETTAGSSSSGSNMGVFGGLALLGTQNYTAASGNVGIQGEAYAATAGTVTQLVGVNGSVTSAAGTLTTGIGLQGGVAHYGGTFTTGIGLRVQTALGTIGTNYGIQVKAQTAGTTDYGIAIETADTQTLWIASDDASATTAAKGIAFGSGRDVNLYRSAADTLKTDDNLHVTTNLAVGTTPTTYKFEVSTDAAGSYVANFFNDGNDQARHGVRVQAGADDGSGTTYYLDAYDGDGGQVGYIANNAGTFGVTDISDARTKTNIQDTSQDASDILSQLRVVDFNRLQNPDGPLITGFIAQEVQDVYGQAVTTGADGMLGVMKDAFIPLLVKGHQDQELTLEDLSARIDALQQGANNNGGNASFNGNIASLNVSGAATINNLEVTGSATVAELTVTGDATFAGDITVEGDLRLAGKVLGNENTRGTVTVQQGQTEVEFTFDEPFTGTPNVILTATNTFAPSYRVEATKTKFTVYLASPATEDINLNYQVQE